MSGQVNVRVRLFALARQLAHSDVIVLSLPESATVRDIRECLARACPALAGLVPQMLIAIDSEYCDEATSVTAKSEVACIPPVSGG